MTLQQLRFLAAIVESDFNITAAAVKLRATQPAVSRQLLLLEQELGFRIFSRNGRGLSRVTEAGAQVIEYARRALRETQNIKNVSADLNDPHRGELRVGSTHTEARYVLPPLIRQFGTLFPRVRFSLHQGTPEQIAEMANDGRIDIAIATGTRALPERFVELPCYHGNRRIIVPASHPLAEVTKPTLAKLGSYPIASHVFAASEPSLDDVFAQAGIETHVALTTRDAEIIKAHVRHGLGVGIIAEVAFEPDRDGDLVSIDASHLFPGETTWAGFAKDGALRQYMYDFLALLGPHLTRESVDRARGEESSYSARASSGSSS